MQRGGVEMTVGALALVGGLCATWFHPSVSTSFGGLRGGNPSSPPVWMNCNDASNLIGCGVVGAACVGCEYAFDAIRTLAGAGTVTPGFVATETVGCGQVRSGICVNDPTWGFTCSPTSLRPPGGGYCGIIPNYFPQPTLLPPGGGGTGP